MHKNKAIEIANNHFKHYPSVNDFHITTDGQAFEKPHDADAHAKTLDKKNPLVHKINRDDQPVSDKVPIDPKQKEVDKAKGIVAGFEKALEKAAAAKKPAIQTQLDEAKKILTEAEKALTGDAV